MRIADHPVVKDFNPSRIEWGAGELPLHIGIDPRHPRFVVRRLIAARLQLSSQKDSPLEERKRWMSRELRRYIGRGAVQIPEHHYITTTPLDMTCERGYLVVRRLRGETPDIYGPNHTPLLIGLGRATLDYLRSTPVGAPFADELPKLNQHTVGWHWGRSYRVPPKLYIHDIDPQNPNIREAPDDPCCSDSTSFRYVTNHFAAWVNRLSRVYPTTEAMQLREEVHAFADSF